MSCCTESHENCADVRDPGHHIEYVIDTSTRKLVRNPGISKYAALSYVWGGPETRQLKLKDLMDLEPGQVAWHLGDHWEKVPQTIKDTILLCELLSIPYLWVDALCILQDRPTEAALCNTHLAQQMCDVYQGAYLTIVAAGGKDSWAGLPGLRSGTRKVRQHVLDIKGTKIATLLPEPRRCISSSVWNTRAWTFQESVLSNRLLVFSDTQCLWRCNEDAFCEDVHGEVEPDWHRLETNCAYYFDILKPKRRLLEAKGSTEDVEDVYEHYMIYIGLVEDFASRRLTYQSDALEAFAGIAHLLKKQLDMDFLWGVSLSLLEAALLFNAEYQHGIFRRRECPSWSWLGWYSEGAVRSI